MRVVGLSHEPEYLLVLEVNDSGNFKEAYNGPGGLVLGLL